MVFISSAASYFSNTKPLPLPFLNSVIVSAKPPVALTIGIVPYFRLYIWFRPHGSYFEGIKNISLPASIKCASSSENPKCTPTFLGFFFFTPSKNFWNVLSPEPSSTNCTSSFIRSGIAF